MILVRLEDTQARVVVASVTDGGICFSLKSPWTINSRGCVMFYFVVKAKQTKYSYYFVLLEYLAEEFLLKIGGNLL